HSVSMKKFQCDLLFGSFQNITASTPAVVPAAGVEGGRAGAPPETTTRRGAAGRGRPRRVDKGDGEAAERLASSFSASRYPCTVPTSTYASPACTAAARPPPASQALTSVPTYSSRRSGRCHRRCSAWYAAPGRRKPPQIHDV